MKAKKIILRFVVIPIVILLLAIIVVFYIAGGSIMTKAVEKAASSTLGVPVTVKSVSLSLLKGQVGIRGLVIENPPESNYANPTLLELDEGIVELTDIRSLMSDTIKIQLIKLDGTKMTIEQKGLTNNLKEILNKLPKEGKKEKPKTEGPGKNVNITKMEITGTNVRVKILPIPGKSDTLSLKLDPIVMENLGTESKLSMGTLFAKVLGALATGIAKQGAGVLPDDMVKGIGSALGGAVDLGKAATKEGQKVLEKTTDAGKSVVDGLTGLLGGKKSEPNKEQ